MIFMEFAFEKNQKYHNKIKNILFLKIKISQPKIYLVMFSTISITHFSTKSQDV